MVRILARKVDYVAWLVLPLGGTVFSQQGLKNKLLGRLEIGVLENSARQDRGLPVLEFDAAHVNYKDTTAHLYSLLPGFAGSQRVTQRVLTLSKTGQSP
jgi:hypothetical protein